MRLLVGSGAVLATVLIGLGFYAGGGAERLERVENIIYVNSWGANRTRQDALDDRSREAADLARRLQASRAYISSLPPEKRKLAQAEYDRYLAAPAKDRVN
ncbi:hypothetical protein KX816_02645 [Sphingosinicellaceae bacterium]|nr:hypothetical protein KX816_02645 [Sphingosinicellaceae bacterium]